MVDLIKIEGDRRQAGRGGPNHGELAPVVVVDHLAEIFDELAEIGALEGRLGLARQIKRLLDEVGRASHGFLDAMDGSGGARGIARRILQKRGVAENDGKQVVEVVANLRSHGGKTLGALELAELRLGLRFKREVDQREQPVDAAAKDQARVRGMGKKRPAALVDDRAKGFEDGIVPGDERLMGSETLDGSLGRKEHREHGPEKLGLRVAEDVRKRGVDRDDGPALVDQAQAQGKFFPDRGK